MSHARRSIQAGVVAIALLLALAGPAGAASVSEPVVEGLVGPLGLAIGKDGTLYIAEAFLGQLTAVDRRGERRTLFQEDGGFVAGVDATGRGNVVFTRSLPPEDEEAPPPDTTLSRVTPQGKTSTLASPWEYEQAVNPDADQEYGFLDVDADCLAQLPEFLSTYTGIIESNPYAVATVPGGHLVADAAGNSVIRVAANGAISTIAVLPPVPQMITQEVADELAADPDFPLVLPDCVIGEVYYGEPVPTDVEVGPDGHYYVSTLPGGPELPGAGAVWRIDANTGALTQLSDGFSGAVDLAVAEDGTVYVAELFAGRISALADGSVSTVVELPFPGAVEVAPDGTLYATTDGFFGPGSVVTITP